MIAGIILAISITVLLQFFVSYCRSVIAASRKLALSQQAREVTGIAAQAVSGDEFQRLVQLGRLCPETGEDEFELRALRGYYKLLGVMRALAGHILPAAALWAERERGGCAYFAAVALDRRISFSRDLLAEQMANRI